MYAHSRGIYILTALTLCNHRDVMRMVCMYAQSLSCVQLFVTLWTIVHQVPLSMGFPRKEYWRGLPFPSEENLPFLGIEPVSPTLQADSLLAGPLGRMVISSVSFFFSNWDIIASQFCVSFCCTIKCISYGCTYIPSLLAVPSILSILHIYVTTEHQAELPVLYSSFPLALWHMVVYICQF